MKCEACKKQVCRAKLCAHCYRLKYQRDKRKEKKIEKELLQRGE